MDFLPEHLIVIGGSYIGLEFAQMYRRFGSQVTVVEMGDRLIGRDDDDVSDTVKEVLEREGIHVRLNAECIRFAKRGDEIATGVSCTEGAPEVVGSHVLLAVGRVPNTASGHVSARIPGTDRILIKSKGPDEAAFEFATKKDVITIDLSGNVLEASKGAS